MTFGFGPRIARLVTKPAFGLRTRMRWPHDDSALRLRSHYRQTFEIEGHRRSGAEMVAAMRRALRSTASSKPRPASTDRAIVLGP